MDENSIIKNPNGYFLTNLLDISREYIHFKLSKSVRVHDDVLQFMVWVMGMFVIEKLLSKSCNWYNVYIANRVNRIYHALET